MADRATGAALVLAAISRVAFNVSLKINRLLLGGPELRPRRPFAALPLAPSLPAIAIQTSLLAMSTRQSGFATLQGLNELLVSF